jgi:hypothetical protein
MPGGQGTFSYSSTGLLPKTHQQGKRRAGEVLGAVINHYGDVEEFTATRTAGLVGRTRCTIFPGEETVIFGEIVERRTP